jgi:ATP-binding cassette subfamily B protein
MGLTEANLKVQQLMALLSPLLMVIMNFSVIAVIYIGGWQVQAKEMQVGEVMAAITYLTQVLHGIMMISMMFQTMARASASGKRVLEVLETEPVINDGDGKVSGTEKGTVTFRNVTFAYPESSGEPVLTAIDLEIKSGETVAILGATGSGKSSLVNLIPRFYDADAGEVLVDGVNVREYKLEELRRRVGIVLQKSELFSASVAENIRWGDESADMENIMNAAKIAQADEFISRMPDGYDSMIAEKGASLSGGQKQRMSIARAVLKKPEILIFDDSTSAVDTKTDAKIRSSLKNKLPNTTKIIISQRIISLKDCDKIIVMDNGRIVAFDTHEKLLENCALYKDINEVQNS